MNPQLQEAIDNIYTAFGDLHKPATIEGCPCCIDDKGVSTLVSKPLRSLSPGDLTHYASSVFLTVSGDEFLYFLPRIMEILVSESGWWPDVEVVGRAINDSEFNSWSARHRESFLHFIDVILDDLIATEDSGSEIDSWICALGAFHADLSPYLERISQSRQVLLRYYEHNSQSLLRECLTNSFWDETSTTYNQVLNWFKSTGTRNQINAAYGL